KPTNICRKTYIGLVEFYALGIRKSTSDKKIKARKHNTVYKKLLVLANTKLVACLLASDFPSENPRPETRNFPYTTTLGLMRKSPFLIKSFG
ncbi:hypothetical protein, partial [Confluentibacter lentus]|uniref:hypothetical protein n=1 Tax=Confluentibacter lentus TaxID=1699412 RepID=UPI001E3646C0